MALNWAKAKSDAAAHSGAYESERIRTEQLAPGNFRGATPKQWGMIRGLSEELGIEPPTAGTRRAATATITQLKNRLAVKQAMENRSS